MTGLDNATQSAGSASKPIAALGISKMFSLWKRNGVPADGVLAIYSATDATPRTTPRPLSKSH